MCKTCADEAVVHHEIFGAPSYCESIQMRECLAVDARHLVVDDIRMKWGLSFPAVTDMSIWNIGLSYVLGQSNGNAAEFSDFLYFEFMCPCVIS